MNTPRRVTDIFPGPDGSNPTYLTAVGNTIFFRATDGGTSGFQLWKTDGIDTSRVSDIRPGAIVSTKERNFTAVGNTLFFTVKDGTSASGTELWKSDGTDTSIVSDIFPGRFGSYPSKLTAIGNTLFFGAKDDNNSVRLWKTDGTNTSIVFDIYPGGDGPITDFTAVGNTFFFTANDGTSGPELWKTDGTNTSLVKDINPRPFSGSNPRNFTAVGNTLFFVANDGDSGFQLWKTDGTDNGTSRVKDINPGVSNSIGDGGRAFTAVGNTLFFVANDGDNGFELWKTDGTNAGTRLVKDINPGPIGSSPGSLTAVGNTLFFVATDGTSGTELWKTDGTDNGTSLVKDISLRAGSSNPRNLTAVGNTLYFTADDGSSGIELWKTDGTKNGTTLVFDINSGRFNSSPNFLTVVGNTLFFAATDGTSGYELWALDLDLDAVEPTITLDVTIAAAGGINAFRTALATNTLTVPASVAEDGAQNLLYTFTRTGPNTSALSVNYTVDGTATLGADYTGVPSEETIKSITFEAGSSTAVLTVNLLADAIFEGSETIDLTLAAGTGYTIGTTTAVTVTITDGDDFANDSSTTGSISVGESRTGAVEIALDRDWFQISLQAGRTYRFNLNGNTLADPYLSLRDSTGTQLAFNDDSQGRNSEIIFTATTSDTFYLDAGAFVSGTGDSGTGSYTLLAADVSPAASITLAVSPASVTEDGITNLLYTFTRTGATTSALTINYGITGTADATDYTGATPGAGKTITFAAGSATATLTIDPKVGTTVEANETVALTLAAGTGYTIGTTTAVTGTITNDDVALPAITLAVTPASVTEDGAPNLVYTFSRTGATTSALTINYGITGTADATDYTGATPGAGKTISFAAGSATATLTIDPKVDTTVEANETVALTLAAGTGYTIGTTTAVTGTITNDDVALPAITLAVSPASVTEDGVTNLLYTFTRTGATTSALTVNYTVAGTATLGTDYTGIAATGTTKTVFFAAGSATALVTVDPTADATVEANETVALTLAAGTGYTIGTTTPVTGTITNDDVQSAVTATLVGDQSSLLLTGTNRINGAGNALNNSIFGNASNNRIVGGLGKDILTGGGTTDSDTFAYNTLSESLLSGHDVITDFNSRDRLLIPFDVETATLAASAGNIQALTATAISGLLSTSTFAANRASAFTATGQAGTFIALNDGRAGFQSDSDAVIFLRGFAIGSANVVELV
jgi:ELWxxDGT repeat protein